MLALLRFDASNSTPASADAPAGGRAPADLSDGGFLAAAQEALALLAARPGFRSGQIARSYDQPGLWCLVTEWESVGAYRRAMGSYEVRAGATPLLSSALPEPSAYEPLAAVRT